MIGFLFGAIWAAGSLLEYAAVDQPAKIFWFIFQAACSVPTVTAVTCFILEYAWPGRWLTRRNLALLFLPWLLHVGLILTNDRHHLMWRGFSFEGSLHPQFGPAGWLLTAYGLVILETLNLIVFGWLFLHSSQHRWPVSLMLVGQLCGRTFFLLDRTNFLHSGLPLDLFGMDFEFLMYAVALFGFRFLDPIPLARQTVIEQIHAGMLVLDPQEHIVSLNPVAERILGLPAKAARGKAIRDLLAAYPEGSLTHVDKTEKEFCLESGQVARYYLLEVSRLNDWRGLEAGRLLMLRDVTEQKRTQAQILEQQRALATLQERVRLARELHDGIGQVLGYVKMQAQAARDRLAQGQTAEVDGQLAQLITVAQDAHADVREYILGVKTAASGQPGFIMGLRQYLKRFSEVYELRAELVEPPGWDDDLLEPTVEAQLLRIIQEALTNVRKHAQATCVQVVIQLDGARAQITVQDDGIGFDPAQLPNGAGQKYGLGFLCERAAEVGGKVVIHSSPGLGTRVVVDVPRRYHESPVG